MRMFKCNNILLEVNLVILFNWSINLAAALALKSLHFNIKKCKAGAAIQQKTSQKPFLINCFLVQSSAVVHKLRHSAMSLATLYHATDDTLEWTSEE